MILHTQSLIHGPEISVGRYQNIRDYLWNGPPVHFNYTESKSPRWDRYEKAVKETLGDPDAASWLDGPLQSDWLKLSESQSHKKTGECAIGLTSWYSRYGKRVDDLVMGLGILFWILHITAALGHVVIPILSESNGDWIINP